MQLKEIMEKREYIEKIDKEIKILKDSMKVKEQELIDMRNNMKKQLLLANKELKIKIVRLTF